MAEISILDACDDPRLFGIALYPRQRELLDALDSARINVWALGRRSGKTTMAAIVCLHDALLRPELQKLVRPGERRYAVAVATNLRQARLIVAAARTIVERSPVLRSMIESVSDDEILFRNGTAITAMPCTSRGNRGYPISCVVFDELAHFIDNETGNSAAESVWNALTPSLAQFGEQGRIIAASTPYGSDGLFASLFEQASRGELPDAAAATFSTAEMNPTIPAAFLERERARDPETHRSEYLAEFAGSGGAFIDPQRISACVGDYMELRPAEIQHPIVGLDPAFSSDPFGLVVVGRDRENYDRLRVAVVRDWKPGKASAYTERRENEDRVLDEVADVCRRFGAPAVTDQFNSQPITDALRRRGVLARTHAMSAPSKTEIFTRLRSRIIDGSIDLPDHPQLLAELRRLRTRYAAGKAAVVNPRVGGSHGDLAQALAIAVAEHDRNGRRLDLSTPIVTTQESIRRTLGDYRNQESELPLEAAQAIYGGITQDMGF